jgi:cobalt-zinc-cadmium resistance protein CzcA
MLERIIRISIAHRWMMLLITLAVAVLGGWSFTRLPIDATPDITNVQVQINTQAPGFSALEAEQRVTFPIETALAGLAHLDSTRSLSRYGLSYCRRSKMGRPGRPPVPRDFANSCPRS